VLFQAGQSPAGKAFAAKHAEAVFVGGGVPKDTAPYVKEMRAKVAANGRNPDHLKVFPQITPILGRTLEEAEAKRDRYKALVDYKAGLAKLSGYLDVDFLALPPDEPFKMADGHKPEAAIHALINTLKRYDHLVLTPRMLGETMAFCGFGAMPVGTPEMVADVIEDWVNNADIDGFNVACMFPSSLPLLKPVINHIQTCQTQNPSRTLLSSSCPSFKSVD
jgi:alkanesulfonate monooxygenase SsuD/methylene tetrahydromethanopterin reductase-like flavin-dependent oxidoreductase (luciferase family)